MNEIIKKFNEGVISELCKVLAIRYKYADGEAMTWIVKNILSVTKEIDGHQYGLKIVQLDGELPFNPHIIPFIDPATMERLDSPYHLPYKHAQLDMQTAGYKYPIIEEEK